MQSVYSTVPADWVVIEENLAISTISGERWTKCNESVYELYTFQNSRPGPDQRMHVTVKTRSHL